MKEQKDQILNRIKTNNSATVAEFVEELKFSRAYIHRLFKELTNEGEIVKIGQTRAAKYVLAKDAESLRQQNIKTELRLKNTNLNEDKVLTRLKKETGIFSGLKENVARIVDYAFTEMLNNAIEHSRGSNILIKMNRSTKKVIFDISDNGVGIFNNIAKKKGLKSTLDAVRDLLKGKQTTMPKAHSGEGIFFTSRLADKLMIYGSDHRLIFDNILDDVFLKGNPKRKGTRIYFEIAIDNTRGIENIFKEYTNRKTYQFEKTEAKIKLYELDTDYISRSQARRLLAGLEKFNKIVLDFDKVNAIGQGFADEVFRIWAKNNPDKKIITENMNTEVEFMIKRAKES